MCDDWDDNPVVEAPTYDAQARPIQSQSFQNQNFRSDNRGFGRDRGGRFNQNRTGDRGNRNSGGGGWFNRDKETDLHRNRNSGEGGRFNRERETDLESEFLNVPSNTVGRIIGRGGCKINELQSLSGAKIQVTKDTDGDNTVIKILGKQNEISKAKALINELTTPQTEYRPIQNYTSAPLNTVEAKDLAPKVRVHEEIDWQAIFRENEEAEKAEWDKYPPIKKDFYVEHPEVTNMTEEEVRIFRKENNNIVVDRTFKTKDSAPIPKPCPKFYHAFHNYPEIIDQIDKAGFTDPSPIQAQAWPVLLSGEDLIGIAQTGTGKTLAFLLPAMIHIDGQGGIREERGGPAVLVMAPTRELALQIHKEVQKYYYRGITSVCLYGGGNRREQVQVVMKGVDIVIATPGRLNDLVAAGHLDVRPVTYVVLDEADRMLDMGFEPQIRKVMYAIRPTRQTVMTSATWPPGVRRLADSYMHDPVQIYVGSLDLAATHTVTQIIQMMPDSDEAKLEAFMDFAQNLTEDEKVIVFCGKKARADELASELVMAGIRCQTLHGDRDQCDREQALLDIKDGTVQILIATDVASRGLDIDDLTHVFNYDFPRGIEEYVHRVGRTGRAGKSGIATSYFTRGDWAQAKELINILEKTQQYIPEEIYDMAERHDAWKEKKEREGGGRGGRGGGRFNGMGGGRKW